MMIDFEQLNLPYYPNYLQDSQEVRRQRLLELIQEHPEDELLLQEAIINLTPCHPWTPEYEAALDYVIAHTQDEFVKTNTYLTKGTILQDIAGRQQEAIAALKASLELNPNICDAHSSLGQLYFEVGHYVLSVEHYLAEIDWYESDGFSPKHSDVLGCANAYLFLFQPDKAKPYYERAYAMEPDDFDTMMGMVRIHVAFNELDAAMALLNQLLKQEPDNQYVLVEIGDIWNMKGNEYRAMHYYTQALEIDPDCAEALIKTAAFFREHEGNTAKAIEELQHAADITTDKQIRTLAYQKLVELAIETSDYDNAQAYSSKLLGSLGIDLHDLLRRFYGGEFGSAEEFIKRFKSGEFGDTKGIDLRLGDPEDDNGEDEEQYGLYDHDDDDDDDDD